ncbi:phosphoenolpyruvate hydrolase family protein [Brevibacillus massiliensis]|uniref:phosphoenolpyruvate hydrolase family protein n=1 Tax=Brevibacillus massiliensis TaxID=1118054 RepID=UPI00036C52D1
MGDGKITDMIRHAHELGLLTAPYVFDEEQARKMTEAGFPHTLADESDGARVFLFAKFILSRLEKDFPFIFCYI